MRHLRITLTVDEGTAGAVIADLLAAEGVSVDSLEIVDAAAEGGGQAERPEKPARKPRRRAVRGKKKEKAVRRRRANGDAGDSVLKVMRGHPDGSAFKRADLIAGGASAGAIQKLLAEGKIKRAGRGLYALA